MEKDNLLVCRCEEITRDEIIQAIRQGHHTISSIKRATRAGMGACQGRTCGRLIQQILATEGGALPADIQPDKPRFPTVPCESASLGGDHHEP